MIERPSQLALISAFGILMWIAGRYAITTDFVTAAALVALVIVFFICLVSAFINDN